MSNIKNTVVEKMEYKNFTITVKETNIGHVIKYNCAYIDFSNIPDLVELLESPCDDYQLEILADIKVHGGFTYRRSNELGWDYAHIGDKIKKYNKRYALKEAINVADQLLELIKDK